MKNYPHFDVGNLPMEVNNDYMKAVLTEETRVCAPLDARIGEMENQYLLMSGQLKALSDSIESCSGFFVRWGIQAKMKAIGKRMVWHRAVIAKLYNARWKRTYG